MVKKKEIFPDYSKIGIWSSWFCENQIIYEQLKIVCVGGGGGVESIFFPFKYLVPTFNFFCEGDIFSLKTGALTPDATQVLNVKYRLKSLVIPY